MDTSIVIAIIAVAVSIGSFAVSVWATRISKESLEHVTSVQEKTERREFDRVRAELLNQIADCRAVLDRTRIEIGTLQANFLAEPTAVQSLMANYTSLFSGCLPNVESALKGTDELWREVAQWEPTKSHKELMDARAVLYRSLQDDKSVYENGMYLVSRFAAQLEIARHRVRGGLASGRVERFCWNWMF